MWSTYIKYSIMNVDVSSAALKHAARPRSYGPVASAAIESQRALRDSRDTCS